jgi:hypothetical protein
MGSEDLKLAVSLDLPLFAPEPDDCSHFGSKSGGRRVFASADVPIPIGLHDVFEPGEFFPLLARYM